MFRIVKEKLQGNTWARVKDYLITSSDIQDICDEFAKLDFTFEELIVQNFGAKEDLALIFLDWAGNIRMEVYSGCALCGHKNILEVSDLYNFLSILYAEQKIGGIETFKFLLDLTDTY